jgi:hypothetical protein
MIQEVDMSNQGVKIFFLLLIWLFISSCDQEFSGDSYLRKSGEVLSNIDINNIYSKMRDSVNIWSLNNLDTYTFKKGQFSFMIDSTICVNKTGTKLVGCILTKTEYLDATSDGLIYLYGEKIDSNWFFFRGGAFVIPREMFKDQDIHTPLSYQQLHEAALKNVFAGYLTPSGEINEAWFTSHFEHVGWGDIKNQEYDDWCFKGKRYTNIHEYYQACHLCKVKANWASRDTTQPVKQLPEKTLR